MKQSLEKTDRILRLRNYSPKTRKAYSTYIREYLEFIDNKKLTDKQTSVEGFLLSKQDRGLSPQTVNLALNSIRFYYSKLKNIKSPF